ncbi:MAG: hypothetical protein QOH52_2925 [Pseudonocardiales bacterium]|nr:hypothetical protein [Pseudonocardiales bacterium]
MSDAVVAAASSAGAVHIDLLGRFRVFVGGREIPSEAWPARRSVELVQLLALANAHCLLREQVIDALWPHLAPEAGAANLRKAAHHARQALADQSAVVLRGGQVTLFPGRVVTSDVGIFEAAAGPAARAGDAQTCAEVAGTYGGELLPDSLYEEWTQARRGQLHLQYLELLRCCGDWQRILQVSPVDETACRELMAGALREGNRHAAIHAYGQLRTALQQELGLAPSHDTEALYQQCVAGLQLPERAAIGRQAALADAHAALGRAARAEVSALIVRGNAGIGKSTFCRELSSIARDEGWMVVTVQAITDSGPYAVLVEAIEILLSRDRTVLDALPDRARSVLAELTMLAAPAKPLDGPVTRHQVIGAARRLVLAAAGTGRLMLVVDDAHLADDDAVEALLHLAGVSGFGGMFVVLAYRAEPARDPLSRGVARLSRADVSAVIDLGPLDRDDAAALARSVASINLTPAAVTAIVDLAHGNPFFILELTRNAEAGVLPGASSGLWEAVATRFVDLDDGSISMLERLAVAGEELDPQGILAVTGLDEDEVFALLDAALRADVLIVSGARYRFRHELVRQALTERVPPHRRNAVHRDAARRLVTSGGTPDAIASHWLAGGRPEEAAPWLVAAARRAVRLGAFKDALTHVGVLLEQFPGHAEALCLRAEALEAIGDDRAPTAYAAAAAAVDESQRHEIRAKQALALVRAGDPAAAVVVLQNVEAQTLDGRLAQALALCGAAAMGFADPAVGVAKAAETRALAMESGNPSAVVIAAWAEAAAEHARGELPRSLLAVLHETYALPELAITVFDGQLCVAERLLYGREPYAHVIAFADGLEAEADRLGAARGKAFATTFRGEARLLMGQLNAAHTDLEHGAQLHRAIGAAGGEALSLQRLAEVALYRGDAERAHALLDESLAVARDSNLGFHLFDRIYGTRITAAGDPARAMAALEEAEDAVHGTTETCPGCRINLAVPAALAAARAGDLDRAAAYEAVAERLTTILMRLPGWYAALDEVRGHRLRASGDGEAGHRHLAAAANAYRNAGQPLDARRCEVAATTPDVHRPHPSSSKERFRNTR